MAKSDFQNFWLLTLKNKHFDFSKKNVHKIENVEDIKNRNVYYKLCANKRCTKFQANILFFGGAMVQQKGKGNDVTLFENRLL